MNRKLKPYDLVAVSTPSHRGLFAVVEALDNDTVIVRDPEIAGSSYRVSRDDIKGGPWRPIWHR
jgi:predicted double-glycine peptidase